MLLNVTKPLVAGAGAAPTYGRPALAPNPDFTPYICELDLYIKQAHRRATQSTYTSGSHITRNLLSTEAPNVLLIATSAASRPRAIRMRPVRGALLRGSKVSHPLPRYASNHAQKSIGG